MSNAQQHSATAEQDTATSFQAAFWLVLMLVGLYIGSLNFVKMESNHKEEKSEINMETKAEQTSQSKEKKIEAETPKKEEGK